MQAAELAARDFLASQAGVPPESVAVDTVREQALSTLFSAVENEDLRATLLGTQPLAVFFGYMTLWSVPLLVLALSGGTLASDKQSGCARFSLVRCSRGTWAVGKMLGHSLLLACGLLVGAVIVGALGHYLQPEFELQTWGDLLVAAGRAWVYGTAYLGIYCGLSLLASTPMKARALGLLALFVLSVAHLTFDSSLFSDSYPTLSELKWCFPAQYKSNLWSSDPLQLVGGIVALFAIGSTVFALGFQAFKRGDA